MVYEKVSMGLDWYIKWFASIVLIFGAAVTALDMYPYNMYFQFVGVTGWLIVGIDCSQCHRFINITYRYFTLSFFYGLVLNNLF